MGEGRHQISDFKALAEGCSRQLRGWADKLQNSEIKGQRHLSEKSREADLERARQAEQEADRKAFFEQVGRIARGEEDWQPRESAP
jgi:hypothetical protein